METPRSDIALNDLSGRSRDHARNDAIDIVPPPSTRNEHENHEFSLPPADGGKDAWLFLAAGFVVEALVWG